jgi:glycosyltransferase involved in cell wall biosynthesis
MLAHGRREGRPFDWSFYGVISDGGDLADEARDLGATVLRSPVDLDRKGEFVRALRSELDRGRYDVIHAHHDLVSGVYLAAAAGLPIGRRIVHVHNADESVLTPSAWKARLYRPLLRRLCLGLADRIVGISNHTLDAFLAGRRRRPGRDLVHYYGVDPARFAGPPPDAVALRRSLGLPDDALVLLFGGRLVPEKNPVFAVEVLAELRRLEPRACAIFAGSGSEEEAVCARAAALGVGSFIRMLGWRDDLAVLMRAADWFILPRPEAPPEGFGLAVVEAQLAGLRLLLSRGIVDDPLLPTARFRRCSLDEPASKWAQAAIELANEPAPSAAAAARALGASPMDMDFAISDLMALHGGSATHRGALTLCR